MIDTTTVEAEIQRINRDELRDVAKAIHAETDYEVGAAAYAYALGRVVERERLVKIAEAQRDAYLASENLDPAWIAGWHSAVDHVASHLEWDS